MMKIKQQRFLIATTLLALFPLLPASAQATPRTWRFVTENLPPFTYDRNGKADGPMQAVLQEACRRLRQNCLTTVEPWRRALSMTRAGDADGIFTIADVPERRAQFNLTPPIIRTSYSLFGLSDSPARYQAGARLDGRQIGVYGPSASEIVLRQLLAGSSALAIEELDNDTVLVKLASGRYGPTGLALVNSDVGRWIIRNQSLAHVQAQAEVQPILYAFGLSHRFPAGDFARLNNTLGAMCRDGSIKKIVGRFGLQSADCLR